MSNTLYKITMDGSLTPGVTLHFAQKNLICLLNTDISTINTLFSGKLITIKRNISATKADKYIEALFNAGVIAQKETDCAANLSLVPTSKVQLDSNLLEMTCPKCGIKQAENTTCQHCGIVIAKFNHYQTQVSHSVNTVQSSPYASPQTIAGQSSEETGELNIWGIEGRLGRMRYIAWSVVLILAIIPALLISVLAFRVSSLVGIPVTLVMAVVVIVIGIQISVKRLHDIGWSGWLILITLIPVVGSIFQLLFFVLPGSTASNRYGAPPPTNSTAVKTLFWIWVVLVIAGLALGIIGGMLGTMISA